MSIYQSIAKVGIKYIGKSKMFKYGFNWSPMYRRSTAKVLEVSEDLLDIKIKLPISYKNRNYVNSIFGGSMFSAVDPIPMVQLINILDDRYVVWDKAAEIFFKIPAREDIYAHFSYSLAELEAIKNKVKKEQEIEIIKTTYLTNKEETTIYCKVKKTIYIADKTYYKAKKAQRKAKLKG